MEGGPLFDPESDAAFVRSLKRGLRPQRGAGVELVEMACSMEDEGFADSIADRLRDMMQAGAHCGAGVCPKQAGNGG